MSLMPVSSSLLTSRHAKVMEGCQGNGGPQTSACGNGIAITVAQIMRNRKVGLPTCSSTPASSLILSSPSTCCSIRRRQESAAGRGRAGLCQCGGAQQSRCGALLARRAGPRDGRLSRGVCIIPSPDPKSPPYRNPRVNLNLNFDAERPLTLTPKLSPTLVLAVDLILAREMDDFREARSRLHWLCLAVSRVVA
jgi:hypothetical protein